MGLAAAAWDHVICKSGARMALGPAEKGHSPFPSSERAIYGFALYLGSFAFLGETTINYLYSSYVCSGRGR